MANEELEKRVRQLEDDVKSIGGQKPDDNSQIGKINKNIASLKAATADINKNLNAANQRLEEMTRELADMKQLLGDLKDLPATLAEWDKRITGLLKDLPEQERRVSGLESIISRLPDALDATARQARDEAVNAATRLIVDLEQGPIGSLQGDIIRHEQGLILHDAGLLELRAIVMPEPAADRASALLPQYQAFTDAQMKAAVATERPDVIVEIAKLLKPHRPADKQVLGRLFKAVTDTKLLARLFTVTTARQTA